MPSAHWSGSNSIFCNSCKHWVHKKCSGHKHLTKDPDYKYTRCQGTTCTWTADHWGKHVGPDKLEVVASFCYLGDMLRAAGGCELSTTTHVKTSCKKFKECYQFSLPATSLSRHMAVCSAFVWGAQCSMPVRLSHWLASVAQLDAPSNWRPGGRGFNPRRGRQHSFVEIDHEIFSTVILSLPLIQEGQLSVSGERMCTIQVNRLEN